MTTAPNFVHDTDKNGGDFKKKNDMGSNMLLLKKLFEKAQRESDDLLAQSKKRNDECSGWSRSDSTTRLREQLLAAESKLKQCCMDTETAVNKYNALKEKCDDLDREKTEAEQASLAARAEFETTSNGVENSRALIIEKETELISAMTGFKIVGEKAVVTGYSRSTNKPDFKLISFDDGDTVQNCWSAINELSNSGER